MLDLLWRHNPSMVIENETTLEEQDKIKLLALAWKINEQRFVNSWSHNDSPPPFGGGL